MNKRAFTGIQSIAVTALAALTTSLAAPAHAQTLDTASARQIVQKVANSLTDSYPFPEISAKYSSILLKNLATGSYHNLNAAALADKLNSDLVNVHKDVHLHVMNNEELYKSLATPQEGGSDGGSEIAGYRRGNYGFKAVELDPRTSTAYINIPGPFRATQESFEMAAAAMNMTAYSKYVILDIRSNGGGSGEMGRFLASYFYEAGNEQFYLNGFFKDRTKDVQEWTYTFVPGKRNPNAKVFILVGRGTGSAAEGFAYAMQKLNRATIVGDTTAGAGIAGTYVPLGDNLVMFLPFKMVVAPHTNTGWEGTGVIPDTATGKEDALVAARQMILQEILANPASPEEKEVVEWQLENHQATTVTAANLKNQYPTLAGKYSNNLSITYTAAGFVWNRTEPGKPTQSYTLQLLKPDVFIITGLNQDHGANSSRVYIVRNAQGKIESLTRKTLLQNGSIYTVTDAFRPL